VTRESPSKIRRAAAWSESAFQEVYSRYLRPIYAYILRRVRNHHDAEDLAAHVFAQAFKHMTPAKPGTPEVEGWLFTSARNATANHARGKKKFRWAVSIEQLDDPEEGSDPGESVVDNEDIDRLVEALEKLNEEQRLAILLRFVDKLPHAEIARVLGRTETSSRVLIHRTLADLRKEVS
jgi:RNA polymerase sigma factor (sigma-70 family)